MSARELPAGLANLYPMSNDWRRVFPWSYALNNRNDHYETVYYRVTFDETGKSTEHKVRVVVPRSIFWNAQAALWDIAGQIRRAGNAERRRRHRSRPSKRQRLAERAH